LGLSHSTKGSGAVSGDLAVPTDAYATASGLTPLELLEQMVAAWRADEYDEGRLDPQSAKQ
jgi:hypothetical protein